MPIKTLLERLRSKHGLVVTIVTFGVIGLFGIFVSRAAVNQASFEAESSDISGNAASRSDELASGGSYIKFEGDQSAGSGLPDPIDPGDHDFGRIVQETKPDGGVIVLPDGEYTVSDVTDFTPSDYVVVMAENKWGVDVVRTASVLRETDQYFGDSSKLIFVGIEFKNIVTRVGGSTDIYFWHTRHTYPIETHPDPTETYCGSGGVSPDGITVGSSNRVGVFGAEVDGIGHDAIKLNNADNMIVRGSKITNVDNGGLQEGRGNERCGWDGDDNYHDDGIQIYPGGVDNLLVEDSYVGRHAIPQVDNNGSSNSMTFKNNMFYEEPPKSSCLAINARVKSSADAGATQVMTLENNDAWCPDSQWLVYVGGSRHNDLIINGDPIPSDARNASQYVTRRTGTPDISNTPSEAWQSSNPYDSWPCYLKNNIQDFSQNIVSCS